MKLDPLKVKDTEQRRAVNLKVAYDLSRKAAADPHWRLDLEFIRQVHTAITDQIPHEHNRPSMFRNNSKEIGTFVGDLAHGDRYKPLQYEADIRLLLENLLEWHRILQEEGYGLALCNLTVKDINRVRETSAPPP